MYYSCPNQWYSNAPIEFLWIQANKSRESVESSWMDIYMRQCKTCLDQQQMRVYILLPCQLTCDISCFWIVRDCRHTSLSSCLYSRSLLSWSSHTEKWRGRQRKEVPFCFRTTKEWAQRWEWICVDASGLSVKWGAWHRGRRTDSQFSGSQRRMFLFSYQASYTGVYAIFRYYNIMYVCKQECVEWERRLWYFQI